MPPWMLLVGEENGELDSSLTQESIMQQLPTTQSFVSEFCFLHPPEALSETAVAVFPRLGSLVDLVTVLG